MTTVHTHKTKIAVLISGNGSNLQALIEACADDDYPAEIVAVVSNKADAFGLERAAQAGIATAVVDHTEFESREAFDGALLRALPDDVDLVCLAGFMRILTPVFIDAFPVGRILNTHPSLLPKFGGEGMYGMHVHAAVLAAGERESGVSIHTVTHGVDQGPVVLQKRVDVLADDTPESLGARVLEQEHVAYPQAVRVVAEGIL